MGNTEAESSLSALQRLNLDEDSSHDDSEPRYMIERPRDGRTTSRLPYDRSSLEKPLPAPPEGFSRIASSSRDAERTRTFPYQGEENFKFPAQPKPSQTHERPRRDPARERLEREMKKLVRRSYQEMPGGLEREREFQSVINDLPQEQVSGAQRDFDTAHNKFIGKKGFLAYIPKLFSKVKGRIGKKQDVSAEYHVPGAVSSSDPIPARRGLSMGNGLNMASGNDANPATAIPNFHLPSYEAGVFMGSTSAATAGRASVGANVSSYGPRRPVTGASLPAAATVSGLSSSRSRFDNGPVRPVWTNDVPQRAWPRAEPDSYSRGQERVENSLDPDLQDHPAPAQHESAQVGESSGESSHQARE